MSKKITFGTLKGGVGKSMSAFNVSGILAEMGKSVLVIDVDPQGNATNNFGIDRTQRGMKSVKDIFENDIPFSDVVTKSPVKELPLLDVIPSSIFLAGTELRIINVAGRELKIKNFFEDNSDQINEYDYIIFDTNPSMSIVNQNAFLASDNIILVSDVSMNSYEGAELFIALWGDARKNLRKEDNIKGFLINNFDKRIKLSKDFIEFCKQSDDLKNIMFDTVVPNNVKLKESELGAKPINIFAPESPGHIAFKSVITEMLNRGIV